MNIAIIPARGGSKRIPRKNIKEFCGKPMIAWSIEAAKASGCFDKIIVSTDDIEIAEIAKNWGAEIPFMRPKELAGDFVATRPVIQHAIKELITDGLLIDHVCNLQATAPLVQTHDIKESYNLLKKQSEGFVFSASSFSYPIQRAFYINKNGLARMLCPENMYKRSQDLINTYHDAGQFYWGYKDSFLTDKTVFEEVSTPYLLSREKVQDIDTLEDWTFAEKLFLLRYR
ncbi:MAG: pseudaminic acid cytidylyltransferase [Pseudoalteromonas sp.]